MLMVSYCGQSMSVVRRPSSVVRRASSVVRRAASTIALKAYSCCTPGPIDLILGSHLENLFFASSPEPKGQLTPNLVGSIGVTCRSKIAKIMPIVKPGWAPWQPS